MRHLLITISLFLVVPISRADVTVPGETGSSLRRIQAVDKSIAADEISDALEELQRILDEAGDDLVPLTPRVSVRARRLCHQRIAALPAEALKTYRDKVNERAKKWLDAGEAKRDSALLRKVVDEAFCSKSGDRALDRLGDLAFERGDFDGAERWWRSITLPAGEDAKRTDALVYPDPEVDVALVRAKQLLARLYRGDREGLSAALKAFAAAHPKAEGDLAGQKGTYVETLRALLAAPAASDEGWPTFAGAGSRTRALGIAPGRPNWRIPRPGATWVRKLDGRAIPADGEPTRVGSAQTLAFHPIIIGDQVFIADARYVRAFNLFTGEAQIWFDLATDGEVRNLDLALKLPAPAGLSYTLSAEGDRLIVRMGSQSTEPRPAAGDVPAKGRPTLDSYLVCLDRLKPRRKLWIEKARNGEAFSEFFEGTPLVFDGRAFAAAVRFEGGGAVTAIACHDVESGASRWKQTVDICDVQGTEEAKARRRQHLLTRAGSLVVYCSHSAAVVALEAETGRRLWAARYPSRGRKTDDARPSPRELAPPVYAAGRLFVAPLDYGRVLCLDADTGKLLWESDPLEVVHLLGVAGGELIVTSPDGIRTLAIDTGKSRRDWIQPGDGSSLASFGRGLLAASWVYWPTVAGLRVLDQATGELVDDPAVPFNLVANEMRGNLAAANGCLIVADNERLSAYLPPRQFLEKRRTESRAEPESGTARLRLAVAEADAGLHVAALKNLALVEKNAGVEDHLGGVPLKALARTLRHDVLMARADAEIAAGKSTEAMAALARAGGPEFPFDDRIVALGARAQLGEKAGQPAEAVAAWQEVLAACVSARGTGFPASAHAARHAHDAARNIDRLRALHPHKIYDPFERQASDLLKTADRLEDLVAQYPNSEAATTALARLAAQYARDRPGQAASAYRQMLARKADPAALAGLAEAYERSHAWHAARAAWLRLASDHADFQVPGRAGARDFVPQHLRSVPALRDLPGESSAVTLPLMRTWEVALAPTETLLVPQGAAEPEFVFFVRGRASKITLVCRSGIDGKLRWQVDVPHSVSWLGVHADLLLAAGDSGVSALRLHDGSTAWAWTGEGGRAMSDFRLASGRLFCMEERRRLVALDAGSGERRWGLWAPGARLGLPDSAGQFGSHYLAGAQRGLLQAPDGRGWLIDVTTGRVAQELSAAEPWPRAPVPLDDRRAAVVTDSNHVVIVDLVEGKERCTHATRKPSLTGAAPRVVADGRGAMVLSDGWVLESVDLSSGEALWLQGNINWISPRPADDGSMAVDAESVYLVGNDTVRAFNRATGKERWDFPLLPGAGPWRITRTRGHIVVHASGAARPRPPSLLGGYLLAVPTAPAVRQFPIFFLDPGDGAPVERLTFLQDDLRAGVQLLGPGVVVALGRKVYGLLPRVRK